MVWRQAKTGCASLALSALVAAGCQDRFALTGDGGALHKPLAVNQNVAVPAGSRPTTTPTDSRNSEHSSSIESALTPAAKTSAIQQVADWSASAEPTATKLAPPQTATPPSISATVKLGLNEAIETGLAQNPDLVTIRGTEGVSSAVLGVAHTYPFNPTLQARLLPYNRFSDGTNASVYNYILLWQQFELCHQRSFREKNASAALTGVRWNIHQAELQNAATTQQLYFAALYQRGLRDLAELTRRLNDELLAVMEKRLNAGRAAAADVAMVRIDASTSRQQARLAEVNYRTALLALRRQLNLSPDVPLDLDGELGSFEWHSVSGPELCRLVGDSSEFTTTMNREAIVNELAARRPDVLAARANSQAAHANLGLARASRVPNLWLGPFYSRDSEGIVSLGFQTQMDIPVVNTGMPLVNQREAEFRQQLTTAEQLEVRARQDTRTALDRYEQALELYQQTSAQSNQQLPQELQKLEDEFRKGEIDILRVVQARNSLLLFRRTTLDSLNELAQAAAAMTAASGLPPAALVSLTSQNNNLPAVSSSSADSSK